MTDPTPKTTSDPTRKVLEEAFDLMTADYEEDRKRTLAEYAKLNEKYDREVGDNVRLRNVLQQIADHNPPEKHLEWARITARKAL